MRRQRRETEAFSLSFLDVICCGFGAVILLLMITKTVQPQILEQSSINLEGRVANLQKQLFEIRGETAIFNRDLNAKQEQLSDIKERIAILRSQLAGLNGRFEDDKISRSSDSIIIERLAEAKQSLTEEMQRLLGLQYQSKNNLVAGIPVDSEYIIFVIDTSGSMFSYAWPRMLKEMENTLGLYPEVKGIQVLNDMGNYLFSRYRGEWIPDTPARRQIILNNLRTWNPFSNSSPVEGLTQAIRSFYDPQKKISVYVLGDEFSGESIARVVDTVDQLNSELEDGTRKVRIHAVGFPVQFSPEAYTNQTGVRFATLMRELTFRNGGTFVGLNDYR